MTFMYIDFETQSEINIKKAGSYQYVTGADFAPACMMYAFDDGPVQSWNRWDGTPFPITEEIVLENTLVAYNAEFEFNVLKSKWFKYRDIDFSWLHYDHFIDVQALGKYFGFPGSLDKLAKALAVKYQKNASGTRLINQLCVIKNHKIPKDNGNDHRFKDLYQYCRDDVECTRACHKMLLKPDISLPERTVYNHMMMQNMRGLPIDVESVKAIRKVLDDYVDRCNAELYRLTNGAIAKGTQTKAIAQYLGLGSVNAAAIDHYLNQPDYPESSKKILRLRRAVSHSSTAKFTRILESLGDDDRVRGNLKYYGGHTGRFAGVGFQMHNLPRAQHDNPEEVINDFKTLPLLKLQDKYGNVGEAASKLIRPMIKSKKGFKLMVADYVSIENVLLHWVAGDRQTTEDFRNGLDQYKVYAAKRFHVHYDDVSPKQRTYAKPCVLGLGYGGGGAALKRVASGYGIELSDTAAENDKKFYRETYPMIPDLWYKVNSCMIKAVRNNTVVTLNTGTVTIHFIKRGTYAFTVLPSGRFISYPAPLIQTDVQYGNPCFTYMGEANHQWRRLGDQTRIVDGVLTPDMPIHGGRLVENIIQAMARDLLVYGGRRAEDKGYAMLGSVHDEWIAEITEESASDDLLDHFCSTICVLPGWAKGLPLRAEGYIADRYRKD